MEATNSGAQREREKPVNLLDKNVEIDPVGIVYNITGSAIEDFIYSYLVGTRKIEGVSAVRTSVIHDGSTSPKMALYVFINLNSNDVISGMRGIPRQIANKMDEGNYRVSEKLKNAIMPLCREFRVYTNTREGVIYFICDIFKAIGLMFAVNPRIHSLSIPEIIRLKKKNSIITVIKTLKYLDRDDSGTYDKYQDIISRNED